MSEYQGSRDHNYVVEPDNRAFLDDVVELLNALQRRFVPEAKPIHGGKGFCTKPGLTQSKTLLRAIEQKCVETAKDQANVQALRDRVLAMVAARMPEVEIPKYRKKATHGKAAAFFKQHYAPFIVVGQEVIFAPDLAAIDEQLLNGLRNECRSDDSPMPLGTRSDRTSALIMGRFVEGRQAEKAARAAASQRKRAEMHEPQAQAH